MSIEAPEILLGAHLTALKLPTVPREHQKLARQCALDGVDHVRYLARLIEMELIDRERRMVERRIKAARFPAKKTLHSFDFRRHPQAQQDAGARSGALRMTLDPLTIIPRKFTRQNRTYSLTQDLDYFVDLITPDN